jgi:phosphatidyl-myo-inositol dimannoside synthase
VRILLVTNDFPPRVGGIQSYLWNIYEGLSKTDVHVRVLAPRYQGDEQFDRSAGVEVIRYPHAMIWPSPALRRRARDLARDVDVVAFGAVLPMNLIGSQLRKPVILHTHGFEVAWARVPGMVQLLRRIAQPAASITVVSEFTRHPIERALGARVPLHLLRTGVDLETFTPDADGKAIRERYGLGDRPVVVCVSRLVARKGQDQIVRALPAVRARVPDATALIVGDGPARARLERLARSQGLTNAVVFTGEVPHEELSAHYAAGDIFAMPCRSRFAGLEVEGLGLVYLEAAACARAVITGDSGGAPEAVRQGETGFAVPGRDTRALADAIARLLGDPSGTRAMGSAGRRYVEEHHRWDDVVARFGAVLNGL